MLDLPEAGLGAAAGAPPRAIHTDGSVYGQRMAVVRSLAWILSKALLSAS